MFFDLIDGKECENPYNKASWKQSWNYMLPVSTDKGIYTRDSNTAPPIYAVNMYVSSDKAIATVSESGKITAIAAGSCNVYVIAANGLRKTITVTVGQPDEGWPSPYSAPNTPFTFMQL